MALLAAHPAYDVFYASSQSSTSNSAIRLNSLGIMGHQNAILRHGNRRNEHIIWANRRAGFPQFGPDTPIRFSRPIIKGQ